MSRRMGIRTIQSIGGLSEELATPSTVGATTHSGAISRRSGFFAKGLYWVFYSDGTNLVYKTTADSTENTENLIRVLRL